MPFLFIDKKISFSLAWPIMDCKEGNIVTRDFYPNQTSNLIQRQAHLYPFIEISDEPFNIIYEEYIEKLSKIKTPTLKILNISPVSKITKLKYNVYSDIELVNEYLKNENFIIVNSPDDADILWFAQEFKNFENLSSNQIINQFPNEYCIVFKHMLPITISNYYGIVDWFPITYNLETQLPEFIGDFNKRKKKNEENFWISKPWNLGRSMGMIISNNINCLIRLSETGPIILSKYIEKPLLYYGKKFDLRFIVLLKSIIPLELYIYNFFWIRLANKPYSLDNFEDYEKHFTVMNYSHYSMTQLHYKDFIKEIELQYPGIMWLEIQEKINQVIKNVFVAASNNEPPYSIEKNFQSRAIYGIDLMINEKFQPILLEINFSPDTTRACNYDPSFYNNIFTILFLNEERNLDARKAVTKL
jgi:tubulin--tyrosine ligase-like protein 12